MSRIVSNYRKDKIMLELLKDWKGEIDINDKHYDSVEHARNDFKRISDEIHIVLHSATKKRSMTQIEAVESITEYKITVKKYMTEPASPEFDFMAKWNNNNPMPLRTMVGTIEKETRGMVYMKLHGQAEPVIKCMRCGRTLTNSVSKLYGIGPECITKIPFIMNIDLNDVEGIKKKLVDVTWEGWIIKSAITEQEEI